MTDNSLTKDKLLETLTEFYTGQIKPDLENLKIDLIGRIDKVEEDVSEIKLDIRDIKDDIKGIKADLSTTVSKKEFNQLIEIL